MSACKPLSDSQIFTFGPYRLRVRERVLEKDGRPLAIPEKTLDVLCVLVASRGQLVERETLMRKVWPGTFVEDSNIAFQISTLRRLLEESANSPKFIATVPKRGYRFIADVVEELAPGPDSGNEDVSQPAAPAGEPKPAPSIRRMWIGIGAALILAFVVGWIALTRPHIQSVAALSEKGTI